MFSGDFKKKRGSLLKIVHSYRLCFLICLVLPFPGFGGQEGKHLYADQSVLEFGDWYKFKVDKTGIYKVTYQDLVGIGLDPTTIDPRKLRLYGNPAGMLAESNFDAGMDDLSEMAIYVQGEEDGHFDTDDYILFYGQSSTVWSFNPFRAKFEHTNHLYDDYTYYFLTVTPSGDNGRRLSTVTSTSATPTDTVVSYNDFACYDPDLTNLIKSGKEWYGKKYSPIDNSETVSFDFPDIDTSALVYMRLNVAAKSTTSSTFTVNYGNTAVITASVSGISPTSTTVYARKTITAEYFQVTGPALDFKIIYDPPTTTSLGWLNYLEINVTRHLLFPGGQVSFRDINSMGRDKIAEFIMSSANEQVTVWEVSNPLDVRAVAAELTGTQLRFRMATDTLRHFIAFDKTSFYSPVFVEKVINQNLHGIEPIDMVIVSHPLFLDQAFHLADLHNEKDGLTVAVVTPQQIYNEFSSGSQDIAAIRNFMRMLYKRADSANRPRYLLLVGDGTYDPKDRVTSNTNFIPTFQSRESLLLTSSFVSDDFFGLFDPDEGNDGMGGLDIGIGRLPVTSEAEAEIFVGKIEHYLSTSQNVLGNWRNNICYVADDEDNNLHFKQAEELSEYIRANNKTINIDKIYFDAFKQISTPAGQRYPDAKKALNKRVEDGVLILNYTGHGGEEGWSDEKVLEMTDINSWTNFDRLPLFVTATCEFSRFDDPGRTSAGEQVFLNPNGGGIALITTTRLAFAQSNFLMNKRFYEHVFEKSNGQYWRIGDLIRLSKNPPNDNIRNIVLLGDPALQLAYPRYSVITTSFNNSPADGAPDTVRALSTVAVRGAVVDDQGNIDMAFGGTLFPLVYDKPGVVNTLGNDPKSFPAPFYVQKNILYKGQVSIINGEFSFSFMLPKDISYSYGNGKISYYARNAGMDASGYYDNFIIGDIDQEVVPDMESPVIRLFMNDTNFRSGDVINENPLLLAYLTDDCGINANGIGIGHEIIGYLDGHSDEAITLNDYFEPGLDTYQSGIVRYYFHDLAEGPHTLTVKAWDLQNNSSTVTIDFMVSLTIDVAISHVMNYPNPVTSGTSFQFDHNQFNAQLQVEIRIFDMLGNLMTTIGPQMIISEGYHAEPIYWDGTGNNGSPFSRGIYIYQVIVDNNKLSKQTLSGKLIIFN